MPRLLSATVAMSSGTIVSKALGLVRVLLVGNLLGNNSRQGTMYMVATTVPSSLYLLLAGGALNAVLVPELVRHMHEDDDDGEAYTNRVMTAFLLLVAILAVVLTLLSPFITALYSQSEWRGAALADQYRSMVFLTTLCLPQVFFYGMFFVGAQVLNARGSFGPMMWAPVGNNVIQVLVLGCYAWVWGFHTDTSGAFTTNQVLLLGIGSLVGIVVQAVLLWAFMKRTGFRYRPRFDLVGMGLGRIFTIAKWTLGLVILGQIGSWLFTRIGSEAVVGGSGAGNLAYESAALFSLLPNTLVTVSIATALLPEMSRAAARGDNGLLGALLGRGIRLSSVAALPLIAILAALAMPIATLFYSVEKGGVLVGWTLVVLAIVEIPYLVQFLIMRAFYAMEDTKSPFLATAVFEAVRLSLVLVLFEVVGIAADRVAPTLAFCYLVGSCVQVAWLVARMRRVAVGVEFTGSLRYLIRVTLACVPGNIVAWLVCWFQAAHWPGFWQQFAALAIGGVISLASYLVLARVCGVREISDVISMLRRRFQRGAITDD
jgi:putative peptidoglycan lipid II flippase